MIHSGYLILLTSSSQLTIEVAHNIHSFAGFGYALYGTSSDSICQTLWLIRRPKNDADSIQQTLSTIPDIQSVSIAPLDIPISPSQVTFIRNLFTKLQWDSTSVTNLEISEYFESELKGTKTHYFHFSDHTNNTRTLTLKLLKDLPEYSSEWEERQQKLSEAIANGSFDNIDTSKISHVTVEINEIVEKRIEPFDPPPQNNNQ